MNKSMLAGVGVGIVVALGAASVAGLRSAHSEPTYADVVSVQPIITTEIIPQKSCKNVSVVHQAPVKDQHRLTGTVLGAAAGGVIGHQFGKGNGKKAATAAGIIGGGYAGNRTQERMQRNDTYTTTEQRCTTVNTKKQKNQGYNVTYKIGDQTGKIKTTTKPGDKIPLDRNGQLVI